MAVSMRSTALGDALRQRHAFREFPAAAALYRTAPAARPDICERRWATFGESFAFIVDEAESDYDTFPKAMALGYRGISSKACKGIYKSLINGARAARWSADAARRFLAARRPHLPGRACRAAGHCALLAFHGIAHVGAQRASLSSADLPATPSDEIAAFLAAHPDLYEAAGRTGAACDQGRRARDWLARAGRLCVGRRPGGYSARSRPSGRPNNRVSPPQLASFHLLTNRLKEPEKSRSE